MQGNGEEQAQKPGWLTAWRGLHPVARRLMQTRFLRSIAQGALGVDFTLYLHERHWTAPEIGALLMASGLVGAALSMWVGIVSDRRGRREFLLIYEAGITIGTAVILLYPAAWFLCVVAALFGFGKGANGAVGPFGPAEQAWLAQNVEQSKRGSIFSFNAALQFWGMGIGSLLAGVLPHVIPHLVGPASYAPVFILNLVVAAGNFIQIRSLKETRRVQAAFASVSPAADRAVSSSASASLSDANSPGKPSTLERTESGKSHDNETSVKKSENKALSLLMVVNMLNSLGVGLVAPLLPYWFNVRFGVGPEAIGPVYSFTFILTGISSLVVGRVSRKTGLVKAIVLPRLVGVVLLVIMPFMPNFSLAAVLYVIRSIVNRGSVGARQAFSVNLVRDERRGWASSLNSVSWNIPSAFGPAIGGWLIGAGSLIWPFVIASALQLAYVVFFSRLLGGYDKTAPSRTTAAS